MTVAAVPALRRSMPRGLMLRLLLDLLGMGLLLAALAYYWLGNAFHEIVGTALFALLLAHNTFNRCWWAGLPRPRRTARGWTAVTVNLALLVAMSGLLVSSVMISQTVFSIKAFGDMGLRGGFAARQVHRLAAYWALAIAAIHLGLHWHMVMRAGRSLIRSRPASPWLTGWLCLAAAAIALQGIRSSFEMTLGSKLILHPVLDMWDFEDSVSGFFFHYGCIVGLYAVVGHYCGVWLRRRSA